MRVRYHDSALASVSLIIKVPGVVQAAAGTSLVSETSECIGSSTDFLATRFLRGSVCASSPHLMLDKKRKWYSRFHEYPLSRLHSFRSLPSEKKTRALSNA